MDGERVVSSSHRAVGWVAVNRIARIGAIAINAAQVRRNGSRGRLLAQRQRGEEKSRQRLVVILHVHIRIFPGVVRSASNPDVPLAVLESESTVIRVPGSWNGLGAQLPASENPGRETV